MKAIKRSIILFLSGFLLGACGETTNTTDAVEPPTDMAENWTMYIQEGDEALESYTSDTQLNLEMEMASGMMTDQDDALIHMQVVGDLERGYTEEAGGSLYFEGNDIYVYEGNAWKFYPDSGPIEYPSWYPNIIEALVEIESLVEATHTDGNIELYYEGNDPEVWDAFEEEFTLSIEGVSPENINITLDAMINDTNYYLEDLRIDILGKEMDGDVELSRINILIEVDYFDHDNVDLTNIEEEITQDVGI